MMDVIGDSAIRQIPNFTMDVSQIHGTVIGTQACFEEEVKFSSGRHYVTALACTNVNLAAQTAGEIFNVFIPQATSYTLWLVSNAQGNGVPLGSLGPPAPGGGPGGFWNGPTTIAAGGDGTTPPPAGENTTGVLINQQGFIGATTLPSGSCSANQGGTIVIGVTLHAVGCPVGGGTWTSVF
jgi:hypothetical protein